VDDAVEFGDDGERPMGGRLRRGEAASVEEEQSREHPPPHGWIVMGSDPGDPAYRGPTPVMCRTGVRPR